MELAAKPSDEFERLACVYSLNILDTPPDSRIDCVTQFIADEFAAPFVMVSVVDSERVWLKSAFGTSLTEIQRDTSICGHAICDIKSNNPTDRLYKIFDLKADNRFSDMPYVLKEPHFRSCMGFVLQSKVSKNIGTLTVIDTKPRKFTKEESDALIVAGKFIENVILGRQYFYVMEERIN